MQFLPGNQCCVVSPLIPEWEAGMRWMEKTVRREGNGNVPEANTKINADS